MFLNKYLNFSKGRNDISTGLKIMKLRLEGIKEGVPIWENKFFGFKWSRDLMCIFLTCQIDKNWQAFNLAKFHAATTEASKKDYPLYPLPSTIYLSDWLTDDLLTDWLMNLLTDHELTDSQTLFPQTNSALSTENIFDISFVEQENNIIDSTFFILTYLFILSWKYDRVTVLSKAFVTWQRD